MPNSSRFVEETGHVTLAEKPANAADYPEAKPELLSPASVVFRKSSQPVDLRNHFNWWDYIPGASWRHPSGPQSTLKGLAKHPVVHIAFEDAEAYAKWLGRRSLRKLNGSLPHAVALMARSMSGHRIRT
jgi:formylglycine-generating enzyme required for sulfatase activity